MWKPDTWRKRPRCCVPTPSLSEVGLNWATPLYFPRIFYLRAVVAEKQGKPEEARENWRVFRALSGPDPLMWGEERQAK